MEGTLIQAWAGHTSFVRKDGGGDGNGKARFKDKSRSKDTHESSTDADARLYCKADNASRVRFTGHTLCDNRHGLIANAMITRADGHAQRDATGEESQITLGAGKGYDAAEFIQALPHVVQSISSRVG